MPAHRKNPIPSIGDVHNGWMVIDSPVKGKIPCECICGGYALVKEYDLLSGKSKRCRNCGNKQPKVSLRRTHLPHVCNDLYNRLRLRAFNAVARCTDESHPRYRDWGGRGIKVKFDNLQQFVEYLLTLPGHDNPKLFLDREDNDGHYEAGNLRFVTPSESKYNQRYR